MNKDSKIQLQNLLISEHNFKNANKHKVRLIQKRCLFKKRYSNKNQARYKANYLSKNIKEIIEPYKCIHGKHWHIGHPMHIKRKVNNV